MTAARFDELIHAPTRLEIVSLLAAVEWADFTFIRDEVGLSDSALSKQLTTLEAAGYLEIRKAFVGKRPRTSARLSKAGGPHSSCTSQHCSRSSNDPVPRYSAADHISCQPCQVAAARHGQMFRALPAGATKDRWLPARRPVRRATGGRHDAAKASQLEDRAVAQCGVAGLTANLDSAGPLTARTSRRNEMHPFMAQALAAERIRESRDRAAQHRLAKEALRSRRATIEAAAEPPRPSGSSRAVASVAAASEQPGIGEGRQPAGERAA